jgi:hypothetical protein
MDMMNRIQDEGGGGLSTMHRPSLPRLKNKASLGRLLVFGGVLDFDVANGELPSTSVVPPLPTPSPVLAALYALPASLPARSGSSSPSTTAIMHQQQDKQQSIILRDGFSTPIKQSASSAALRALKMLDHEHEQDRSIKYPASISLGRPAHIPRLDFDHASSAGQGGAQSRRRRAEEEEVVVSRSISSSSHSHALQTENLNSQPGHQSSSSYTSFVGIYTGSSTRFNNNSIRAVKDFTGDYIPPQDINDAGVNANEGGQSSNLGPAEDDDDDDDDKELVKEIQQDMDNGGYSSLEQVRPTSISFLTFCIFCTLWESGSSLTLPSSAAAVNRS